MISASNQISAVSDEIRVYKSWTTYLEKLRKCITAFQTTYPERDWNNSLVVDYETDTDYQMRVKHLIRWKPADAGFIESELGVKLPKSVHDFYRNIETCILKLKNPIFIFSPKETVKYEMMHRDIEEKCNHRKEPMRLIRFAKCLIDGITFAFRQRESDGSWHIISTWNEAPTEYFQSSVFDDAGDEGIDAWIMRLLETDGHPTIDDEEPPSEPASIRVA